MDASRMVLLSALVLVIWCLAEARDVPRDVEGLSPEAVRRLAQVLGLPEEMRPSRRRLPPPPAFMMDLYKAVADSHGRSRGPTPYDASVVRSFQEAEPVADALIQFDVPTASEDEELLEAELHVYVPHVPHVGHVRVVQVWQVTEGGLGRPVDSRLMEPAEGWLVFHVQSAAAAWLAGRQPLGLRLTEETSGGQQRQLNVSRRGHHHNKQPLLVLYSRDNRTAHYQALNDELARQVEVSSAGRFRRAVSPEIPTGCQRRQLYIDFKKTGFETVLAPRGYNVFHCLGRCEFPLTHDERPTNHARVQSLVHQLGLSSDANMVQLPSCVPSRLSGISILYWANGNVVLMNYESMVAEECGCQ